MVKKEKIVIIGGGLTGLSLAFFLRKNGADAVVLDRNDRPGGVIRTVSEGDFIFEKGPNTGLVASEAAALLLDELGDKLKIEYASDAVNKRYVCKKGKLLPLPMNPFQAAFTPLFSWYDKFRILLEPFRRKGTNPDGTLAELVKRRMGKSYLDYAIDPFILGIYAGDPGRLVPKYALPKLYNLEQSYGSFIAGAVRKFFEPKSELQKKVNRKVFSAENGLSTLISSLCGELNEENIITSAEKLAVRPRDNGFEVSYEISGKREIIHAERVISTVGAGILPGIFSFIGDELLKPIESLEYAGVVEAAVGFNNWGGRPLDGFGALIPFKEKRNILGILFISSLFKGRAPENGALFSVFLGGVRNPEVTELPDSEIIKIIEDEFRQLLNSGSAPDMINITRNNAAIPQYYEDTPKRLKAIAEIEEKYPGLILAGNIRDGIGMANRIQQAFDLARNIVQTGS